MIPIGWDQALDLAADELLRVRTEFGHKALFAGSYGWSSAGRFHHARTQTRRFFGALGGFTDQTGNYSWGAAQILLENVLGDAAAVSGDATCWQSIAVHTDTLVAFGGLAAKNWRVTSGGAGHHHMPRHIKNARKQGTKFVVISSVADDIPEGSDATWIAPRPGSDTAIILALCHEMVRRGRVDRAFLSRYCTGSDTLIQYLKGSVDAQEKTFEWAAEIADVDAKTLHALADQISTGRVMLTASWSLQRAHRGEQPYWALIALAAILGQIGLPGGGFSFGYGSLNAVGEGARKGLLPTLLTLGNQGGMSIPVARFADMLESPGKTIPFNGGQVTFPDIKLVYWAGGNPFHHSQDLFRLNRLWARPQTVIVHEQVWTATALCADMVFPATTSLERNDIGGSSRDPHVFYMPKLIDPVGQARNDYDIFSELAARLACHDRFTEGRSEEQWLQHLWQGTQKRAGEQGVTAPDFDALRRMNVWRTPAPDKDEVLLSDFRSDPVLNALKTPSGKIELTSQRIGSFGYDDISSHPRWQEPSAWLGHAAIDQLALLTPQPEKYLHSQLNQTWLGKTYPPTVTVNTQDAHTRALCAGQMVWVYSSRGSCLAILRISDQCRNGVAVMATGAHFMGDGKDRDAGGNPNALTADFAASELSQASAAQSCLIRIKPATTDSRVEESECRPSEPSRNRQSNM